MNTKRGKLDVINKILDVILNIRDINPTNLIFRANLSPKMFIDYKKELIKKKFIKEIIIPKGHIKGRRHKEESKSFKLTKKGREYLQFYRKLTAFKEEYGLNDK
jgi:predicted transcriptional regulator